MAWQVLHLQPPISHHPLPLFLVDLTFGVRALCVTAQVRRYLMNYLPYHLAKVRLYQQVEGHSAVAKETDVDPEGEGEEGVGPNHSAGREVIPITCHITRAVLRYVNMYYIVLYFCCHPPNPHFHHFAPLHICAWAHTHNSFTLFPVPQPIQFFPPDPRILFYPSVQKLFY